MVDKKEETKNSAKKGIQKKATNTELEKLLIENFVSLQSSFSKMAVKVDRLSDNISRLLDLFEKSAREFIGSQGTITKEEKEFIEKLDKLIEQNKIIAKGLTLMEEKIREKVSGNESYAKKDYNLNIPEKINLEDKPKPKLLPSI
jgi:DNA replication initiation complex subunit (GINS family)